MQNVDFATGYKKTPTEEDKKRAQKYARDALSGKSGVYVSPSQGYNAITNAGITVEEVSEPKKTSSGGYSSGMSVSATTENNAMNAYLAELERQQKERQKMLDEQYKQGKQNINDEAVRGSKEAYISFMQGMKNMPQKAAMYGAGGMAQSLANKSQLNYENNRNNIEQSRLAALADLESDYRAGVMDAGESYLTRLSAISDKMGTTTTKGTGTVGTQTPVRSSGGGIAYKIGNTGVKANDEVSLYNQLLLMGFTRKQAEDYMIQNGVITA